MRTLRIAFVLLVALAPAAGASASHQLVAQLATPGAAKLRPRESRAAALAALAPRLAALRLNVTRTLTDGFAEAPFGKADAPGLAAAFVFDPERVVLLEAPDSLAAAAALRALAADPAIDWIEPNRVRRPQVWSLQPAPAPRPRDPFAVSLLDTLANDPQLRSGDQYGLYNPGPSGPYGGRLRADVHALEAWRLGVGSNDVRVAIADTGVDPGHPELGGLLSDGRSRIVDPFNATGEAPDSVLDYYGHGTPVAGVAVARTNNGAPIEAGRGVAGVCGGDGLANAGCRWVPIKISPGHSGDATSFDIARAILHATRAGARAMNLSYASDGPSRLEREALRFGLVHGCVVVAASGNQGFNFPTLAQYPAAFAADGLCIQVGASEWNDERAVFSSYGPGLDLVAPGFVVWTTFMTYPSFFGADYHGYVQASGTSFAAPFGTGAVGLLAAARPELQDVDFQHVLREAADDVGAPGRDAETGWGRLNLARALAAVDGAYGLWHDEAAAAVVARGTYDTLRIGERGDAGLDRWRGDFPAERLEVRATVAIPDSFVGEVRVWPRISGTMAARGDFALPYWVPFGDLIEQGARTFTLRGWLYRLTDCGGCYDDVLPLPADQARFGFTVIGRVDRPPVFGTAGFAEHLRTASAAAALPGDSLHLHWSATDIDTVTRVDVDFVAAGLRVRLVDGAPAAGERRVPVPCAGLAGASGVLEFVARDERGHRDSVRVSVALDVAPSSCAGGPAERFAAGPNPFVRALRLWAPDDGAVRVFDAGGRLVRTIAGRAGARTWDGRDAHGRDAPPGLYFVRAGMAGRERTLRVVRLGAN